MLKNVSWWNYLFNHASKIKVYKWIEIINKYLECLGKHLNFFFFFFINMEFYRTWSPEYYFWKTSMKRCEHHWSDIFLTQYSQDTEENIHRRADDYVDDSASKTHLIVLSKAVCLFWHSARQDSPLYRGLNSQCRNVSSIWNNRMLL